MYVGSVYFADDEPPIGMLLKEPPPINRETAPMKKVGTWALKPTVAVTVEEQNRAVASISEGVNRASTEARSSAESMSRLAGTSRDARTVAADVKSLADTLSQEAESLNGEVRRFLSDVQAA